MAFELHKLHKLDDWLEGEAYEWVLSAILNIYEIEKLEELTEAQIDEIAAYVDSINARDTSAYTLSYAEGLSLLVIGTMMDQWQEANDSEYCYDKGYR